MMDINMATFQIKINGETYCEADDIKSLTLVTEEMRRRGADRISLHASAGDGSMQWLVANLKVGDEINIQILNDCHQDKSIPYSCSFCAKEAHEVSNLMQGTRAMICDQCVTAFSEALGSQKALPIGASIHDETSLVCGFCNNKPRIIPGVIVRNGAAICPECLRACTDILSEGTEKKE